MCLLKDVLGFKTGYILFKIAAVAARDKTRAAEFAAKYKIPVSYDSYEHLAANPDIGKVYSSRYNQNMFRFQSQGSTLKVE